MTLIGKAKLDHPALGTAGGASLHSQIEGLFTKISDYLPSRWYAFTSVAGQTYSELEHNLQVPYADLRVTIYNVVGGVPTKVTTVTSNALNQAGSSTLWLIQAVTGYEQTKVAIKPPLGGPFTFYVFINHCPVDDKLPLAGGTLTGSLTLAADPTTDLQAATKQYVDTVAQGLDPKASCRVATTANITLSGLQLIDGISLASGDRVLVKNQTAQSQNGIYLASASTWTRALDMNNILEFPGAFTFVEQGTAHSDTGWVCTTNQGQILDSSSIGFVQFSGAGVLAGDNQTITVTNNVISAKLDGTSGTLSSSASGLKVNTGGIKDEHINASAAISGSKISPSFGSALYAPTVTGNNVKTNNEMQILWSSEPSTPSDGVTIYCPDNQNIFYKDAYSGTAKQLLTGNLNSDTVDITDTRPLAGLRNRIINGNFAVDQRFNFGGTVLVAGTKKMVCDRWWAKSVGSGPTITATRGKIKLQGAPSLTSLVLGTYIESLNCWDLVNKTVTLSFTVIATGSGGVNVTVTTPSAADNHSTATSLLNNMCDAGTTSQRFARTFNAGACANGLAIAFDCGTANFLSASTYYEISNVQLEVAATATAFEARPYQVELMLCQRYYVAISDTYAHGITQSTDTGIDVYATLPQVMRTTAVNAAWAAFTNGVTGNAAQRNLSAKTLSGANVYGNQLWASGTVATGITALKPCIVRLNALVVDAEITLV